MKIKTNKTNKTNSDKPRCPINAQEFLSNAESMPVQIGDQHFTANKRTFSSGSFGWFVNGKLHDVQIGDEVVTVQVGLNLTVVGSKEVAE